MTISKENRLANEILALRLIGRHYGDDFVGTMFEWKQPVFQSVLPTTWKALVDQKYVSQPTIWHYQLTPLGWKEALREIGTLCDEQTQIDLGRLCAALKNRIQRTKTHATGALVGLHEIVTETGLAEYWISNVIDSHLIAECLDRHDAYWAPDDRMKSVIEVPLDFGLPILVR